MAGPIRGIVLARSGDDRTTDLIVQATASEVAAITLGDAVAVSPLGPGGGGPRIKMRDMLLYDSEGRPAAIITSVKITRDAIDVSAFGDAHRVFAAGRTRTHAEIEAIGDWELDRT